MLHTQEKKIIIIFEDHRDTKAPYALREIIRSDNACNISDITLEDNRNLPLPELIDEYKSIVQNVQVSTDPVAKAMAGGFKATLNLLKTAQLKEVKVHSVDVNKELTNKYHADAEKALYEINYQATQFFYKNGCKNFGCSETERNKLMKNFADTEIAQKLFLKDKETDYVKLRDEHIASEILALSENSEANIAVQVGWAHGEIAHILKAAGQQVLAIFVNPEYETFDLNDIMLKYHAPLLQESYLAGIDIVNAKELSVHQVANYIIGECAKENFLYDNEL
jgi:hypothetical protein